MNLAVAVVVALVVVGIGTATYVYVFDRPDTDLHVTFELAVSNRTVAVIDVTIVNGVAPYNGAIDYGDGAEPAQFFSQYNIQPSPYTFRDSGTYNVTLVIFDRGGTSPASRSAEFTKEVVIL